MKVRYTVPSDASRVAYAGNGSTTVFAVPYVFFDDTDLEVISVNDTTAVETTKVLTTDYSVTGGAGSTGSVTMTTAPATGTTLVIQREIPYTQEIDYEQNDGFPAAVNEEGLDRNTMLAQQVRRRARQTPKLPATYDPESGDITIPMPVAGKTLVANTDEDGWENADLPTAGADLPTALVGLANYDILEYDSVSELWRNKTLLTILGRLLTTQGDLLRRGASGVERLAIGAANRLLKSNGTTESWAQVDLTTDVTGVLPRANGGFSPGATTNSLGANVLLNNTGTYFTGPSLTLGAGVWMVFGKVTLGGGSAGEVYNGKLWDGTTVIDSGVTYGTTTASGITTLALMGVITDPVAAVSIAVKDTTSTSGVIYYNQSGESKDSTLTAIRIG
jgi:hypothetical protein